MSINKVMLIGRLGQDPELRYTQGGSPVCNFSLATNEIWNDAAGNRKEKTEWHRVIVWGKQAENCARYLKKGRQAFVEGKLQTRDWTDQNGSKRSTTEIVANHVQFLDGAHTGQNRPDSGDVSHEPSPPDNYDQSFNDDDIPF